MLAASRPVGAQVSSAPQAPGAGRGATLTARYHVRQMENVLEHAVQHAADLMRRRLQAITPDVLALAGAPRAQGFRIDGYGLFFSVEVPRLSESVTWALRVLSQDRDERVLASLQKVAAAEQDPVVRADLERAIRTMQMQLPAPPTPVLQAASAPRRASAPTMPAPVPPPAASERAMSVDTPAADVARDNATAPTPVASAASSPPSLSTAPAPLPEPEEPAQDAWRDPSAAYEDEVKLALVDAVLDYAGSLSLAPAEWVTVAARDAGYQAFPDAVSDMVTVTLSVRVSDLIDFRAQRLTRDEARARVVVKEF